MKISNSPEHISFSEIKNNSYIPLTPKAYDFNTSSITFREPALQESYFDMICRILWAPFGYLLWLFGFGGVSAEEIQKLAEAKGFIYFYNHKNPISEWLGNFYPCTIKIKGFTFSCSEAAYQMRKFDGKPHLQAKFVGLDGDQAFRLAKKHASDIRSDWDSVKEGIMLEVLEEKFKQNPYLQPLLLATGKAYLVEHNEVVGRDTFWSDNHDGTGQNRLGVVLMALRKKLGGHGIVPAPAAYHAFLRNN